MSLDFKTKRALQKTVAEKQAALKAGTLGFKEKREAQKALRDALTKLGGGMTATKPAGDGLSRINAAIDALSLDGWKFNGGGISATKSIQGENFEISVSFKQDGGVYLDAAVSVGKTNLVSNFPSPGQKSVYSEFGRVAIEEGVSPSEIVDAVSRLIARDGADAATKPAGQLDVSGIKARFTAETVMDVPANWIVMNAPRPLLGTKTMEGGPFLSGRFYAAIDPADSAAAAFVAENVKLDARVVLQGIDEALQIEMVLVDSEYADAYRSDFQGDELFDALAAQINDLQDKTAAELESIIARARGGAGSGSSVAAPNAGTAAAESPFTPLIAGQFNQLPIPDFIKRLESAYEEEESLDKAKQAAIQYLEVNRAALEAA